MTKPIYGMTPWPTWKAFAALAQNRGRLEGPPPSTASRPTEPDASAERRSVKHAKLELVDRSSFNARPDRGDLSGATLGGINQNWVAED
jgi:hypothetical protein